MNCNKIQDLFPLYLENKLNTKIKETIEKHINQCNDCSQFLEEFKNTIHLLGNLKSKELSSDYYQKLNLKLEGVENVLHLFRHRIFVPVVCAVLLILIFGYFLIRENKTIKFLEIQPESITKKEVTAKHTQVVSKPEKETTEISQEQKIETKKTIEIAKTFVKDKKIILRGAGAKYQKKKIIKQWQDTVSGVKTKKSLLIETQKEWQELWKTHTRNISPAPFIPEVDFNKNIVIAVFMGEQKTGGYGTQITQIEESEDNMYIEVIETMPTPDSIVTQQLTQPYHIVVVSTN